MGIDLYELAKTNPEITYAVKGGELYSMFSRISEETERKLRSVGKSEEVAFYTREQVMTKLNVVASTLWRWKKSGYLVPVLIGGQYRYKSTDITDIISGKK